MVECERYEEAIKMVTSLASLFRISLSKGRNIIPIRSELEHAQNYLRIQKLRYKNRFEVRMDVDESILDCCTVKLVVQPLLENSIYYGMESMDDDGEILIRGYRKDGDIYLEVTDNGLGMPEETVRQLLTEGQPGAQTRLRHRPDERAPAHPPAFGEAYGLEIESEPDEGTTVRIHLPDIPYTDEIGREGLG